MKKIYREDIGGGRPSLEVYGSATPPSQNRWGRDVELFLRLTTVILAVVFVFFGSATVPATAGEIQLNPQGVGIYEPLAVQGLFALESASESEAIFDDTGGVGQWERAAAAYGGDGKEPIAVSSAEASSACGQNPPCQIGFGTHQSVGAQAFASIRWNYIIRRADGENFDLFSNIALKVDYGMSLIASGAEARAQGDVRIQSSTFGELVSTSCFAGAGRDQGDCPDGHVGTLSFTVYPSSNSNQVGLELLISAGATVDAEGCEPSQGLCLPPADSKFETSAAEALAKGFLYVDPGFVYVDPDSGLPVELEVLAGESLNPPPYVPAVRTPILPLFLPGQSLEAGNRPRWVAIGDLDGDGNQDLAVANQNSDDISVLINDGNGTFQAPQNFPAGDLPNSVAIGDLDGDGNLDIATANVLGNDVSVLLGNGDGTFQPAQYYAAGDGPSSIVLGDLDGDGDLDVAVGNVDAVPDEFGNVVSVLLNNGDGTFPDPETYPIAGIGPFPVVIGDLDGDGNPDLVAAHHQGEDISVLWGNGDGTFGTPQLIEVGPFPVSVAIGDLDGDGFLDIVAATDQVNVLPGNGDRTFQAQQNYAAGNSPRSIRIGDLDGDGDRDLALANFSNDDVFSVLLNDGNGSFGDPLSFPVPSGSVGTLSLAMGDLDGYGVFDLAVVPFSGDVVLVYINTSVPMDSDGDNVPDSIEAQIGGQGIEAASGEIIGAKQPIPDGPIEITVEDQGQTFTFILPPGTSTSGPGDAIVLDVVSNPAQAAVLDADLPAGATKTVTLPWSMGDPGYVVIDDRPGATVDDLPGAGLDQVIAIPTAPVASNNINEEGNPTGWTVTNNGDDTVTVSGLENTALGIMDVTLAVDIDVKPWRSRNVIELEEDDECEDDDKLRVALFGSRDLDVLTVDVSTLELGDPDLQGTAQPLRSRIRRVNRDPYKDLLLKFSLCDLIRDGALQSSTEQLDLRGETVQGIPLQGSDSVRVVTDDDDDDDEKRRKRRPRRRGGGDDDKDDN